MTAPTTAAPPLRVVLADDHDLLREGLSALLSAAREIDVVGQARDDEGLLALLDTVAADVVVSDLEMPGGGDGICLLRAARKRFPAVRLLVLSMHGDAATVRRAVQAGADGYLTKDAAAAELELAIRAVGQGHGYFAGPIARALMAPADAHPEDELTERQLEIVRLVALGQSSREIGRALGLSPKTVDAHRARIMCRLRLEDIAGVTRYAIRKGLLRA